MLPVMKRDEDKFCLKWDRFHENITSMFDDLRQSEKLVDVTLCSESNKVKVHRLTMSACSPYLRDLLKDNPCEHPVIVLTDTTAFDLIAIVELMYKGAVNVPHIHLESLMKTLEMLQIKGIGSKEDKAPSAPVTTRVSSSRPAVPEASTSEQHSPHHEPHRSSPRPTKRRRSFVQESCSLIPRTASPSLPPPTISPSPPEPDSVTDSDLDDLEADDYESPAVDPLFCPESEEQLPTLEKQLGESADLVKAEEGEFKVEENVVYVEETLSYDAEFALGYSDNEVSVGNSADAAIDSLPSGSGTFSCKHCKYLCISQGHLDRHIRNCHGHAAMKGIHKCEWCDYATNLSSDFKRHCRVHTGERSYSCKVCGKAFRNSGDLVKHNRTHTGVRPYTCDVCGKGLGSRIRLIEHKCTHTGERPYSCDVCGKAFVQQGVLTRHKRIHTGERPYSCDVCGKAFRSSGDLVVHNRIHTGERRYNCNVCGKAFGRLGSLVAHKRTHTGERPYSCDVCGKAFLQSGVLTRHKRTHTGERPYSCDLCGKAYSSSGELLVHNRIHTGERPYSCDVCGKAFMNSSVLVVHNRIHTGERPYSCDVCGKAFMQSGDLVKHKRTHTCEKP